MARFGRYFLPDQPLHVIQRDNNRTAAFFANDDYAKTEAGAAAAKSTLTPILAAQHRAMWDYWPHTRSGIRVTIKGERPV
jgi:hypothetical protein